MNRRVVLPNAIASENNGQPYANLYDRYQSNKGFREPLPFHIHESNRAYQPALPGAPVVSVIIPIHNTENYLQGCIDSILAQTFSDFEIICVDDASTDESRNVAQEYAAAGEPVTVLCHQSNLGPSQARNTGLAAARGEFICFVDSDDGLAPQALERLVSVAREERADVVVCGLDIEHYDFPAPSAVWIKDRNPRQYKVYPEFGPDLLFNEPAAKPFIQRDFIRRRFLAENDLWFSDDFWMGEDTVLQFEMFPKARNVVFLPEELCYYRSAREDSLMTLGYGNASRKTLQHIGIVGHIASFWACAGYLEKWSIPFAEWAVPFFYNQFKLCPEPAKPWLAKAFVAVATQFMGASQYAALNDAWRSRYDSIKEYSDAGARPVPLVGDVPYPKFTSARESDEPRVSIVVPVVKGAKRLARTLGSMVEQTCADFEVLCVTPESLVADGLWKRCSDDERIRVVPVPKGTVGVRALCAGVQVARGAWVLVCEEGDTLTPTLCESVCAEMGREPVDILHFVTTVFSEGADRRACVAQEAARRPYYGLLRGSDIVDGLIRGGLFGASLVGKAFDAGLLKGLCADAVGEGALAQNEEALFMAVAANAATYRGIGEEGCRYNCHLSADAAEVDDCGGAVCVCRGTNPPHFEHFETGVSAVVPVHNAEPWLEECIESIESQVSGTFEIICIDDGSTDGSMAVLQKACGVWGNITVYRWGESHGVSAARNEGLRHARGAYVLFVDADDVIDRHLLDRVLPVACGLDADMTVFGFEEYWGDLNRATSRRMCTEEGIRGRAFGIEEMSGVSTSLVTPNVWRILWKRSFIETVGIKFHEDLATSEDLAFIYESLFSGPKIALVNEALYRYRRDGDSTLTRSYRGLDGYRALRYIRDYALFQGVCMGDCYMRHYVNLVLDVAEYAMGSTATELEYRLLFETFQKDWAPFVKLSEKLIAERYRSFWESTCSQDEYAYLFNLYRGARGMCERLQARTSGRVCDEPCVSVPATPRPRAVDGEKRYARVLYVGTFALGDASVGQRAVDALRNSGHAVLPLDVDQADAGALATLARTFEPTVAVVERPDVPLTDDFALLGIPVISLGWSNCDIVYRETGTSQPGRERKGVVYAQRCTPKRERQVQESEELAHTVPFFSIDGSWPATVGQVEPGTNLADFLRTTAFAVYFEGDDSPSTVEVAMRIAEGNVVVCEEGAQYGVAPGLRESLVVFAKGRLAQTLQEHVAKVAATQAHLLQCNAADTLESLEVFFDRALREADQECQASGHPAVLAFDEPAVMVGFYGWFGACNFGDDLLMSLSIERLAQRYSNFYPWVIGAYPTRVRDTYGYEAYNPGQKYAIASLLRTSRALVYCGGLVFDAPMAATAGECEFALDPWIEPSGQAAIALLARSVGVRPVLFCGGAGPVAWESTQSALRLMAMADTLFLCRDGHSCELIEAAGVPSGQVKLRADLAYGCGGYIAEHAATELPAGLERAGYFMVSLRHWPSNPSDFAERIAAAVNGIVAATGLKAAFVPFCPDDATLYREVAGLVGVPDSCVVFDERMSQEGLFALIQGSAFSIAMRLHCSILHHVLGKPAIGLNYNDKVEAHFAKMGEGQRLFELDFDPEVLVSTAVASWEDRENVAHILEAHIAEGSRMVDMATDELCGVIDRLATVPCGEKVWYPRTISRAARALDAQKRAVFKAQQDCRRLTEELAASRTLLDRVQQRCSQLTRDHADEVSRLKARCDGLAGELDKLKADIKVPVKERRHS